jgi:hypothetical protein
MSSPMLKASVLVINSADDERNPPETGLTAEEREYTRTKRLNSKRSLLSGYFDQTLTLGIFEATCS